VVERLKKKKYIKNYPSNKNKSGHRNRGERKPNGPQRVITSPEILSTCRSPNTLYFHLIFIPGCPSLAVKVKLLISLSLLYLVRKFSNSGTPLNNDYLIQKKVKSLKKIELHIYLQGGRGSRAL
jgi:hypothetical protein